VNPTEILRQSLQLPCGTVLKNRMLKSAMSEALGTSDGAPSPALARLYGAWAEGGIGLCITGNVMVDARALGEPGNVVIEDARHLLALSAWAHAATAHQTQCWVQLNHPGKQTPKGLNRETVAPSAVEFRPDMRALFATPRALTVAEIEDIIVRFATAAALVRQAGFSGVQIHGAHGYLVSQFLSPHHNQRTDDWGGSALKRRRFVLAVYQAIRSAVGADFPVGIKLNSADFQRGGFTSEESLDTIVALADAGMDLIEISGGTYEAPAMTGVRAAAQDARKSTQEREAYFIDFARQARQAVATPLAVTGGFRTAQGMAQAIDSGAVDLAGIARILALEPDLPARLLSGGAARYTVVPRTTGIHKIDAMGILEVSWYTGQLQRMGRGQAPRPHEPALWVFLKLVWHALRARRGRKGLRRKRAR
jgi:2,4-dienoyl-CoA reductase-like NADH-dependent reductase (Old Yellow Enzyme family)